MPTNASPSFVLQRQLDDHLQSWGLKQFQTEAAYYQWQETVLSVSTLSSLQQFSQHRQQAEDSSRDICFYDLAATPEILPVLYSQRYHFFRELGVAIAERLATAKRVLDFGCGVGILTTFWATLFPDIEFVGLDRSPQSIAMASEQAAQRQLRNVRFEQAHIPRDVIRGLYDCLISTHVLFQSEVDPGLSSTNWMTFDRTQDRSLQQGIEERTGVGERLDALCRALTKNGKLLLCEKTQHLGRRVFFQRVLAHRGFQNLGEPKMVTYTLIDERIEDGPLYEVVRGSGMSAFPWDEQPEWQEGQSLYVCSGEVARDICSVLDIGPSSISHNVRPNTHSGQSQLQLGTWGRVMTFGIVSTSQGFFGLMWGSVRDEVLLGQSLTRFETMTEEDILESVQHIWDIRETAGLHESVPWYENHTSAAQTIWQSFPDRVIKEEDTFLGTDGRAMHIELGLTGPFMYVYWANTYDQRQLIMASALRADWLVGYYRESLSDMQVSANS